MKDSAKILIGAIAAVLAYLLISRAIFAPDAKGTNIKVHDTSESTVYFYPVCPECDHVSEMYQVNISKGEDHKTIHMCEKCFNVYKVEIKR